MSSTVAIEKQYCHTVEGDGVLMNTISNEKAYSHSIGAVINITYVQGGYSDQELSADATVENGKSYRTNDASLIILSVPTNLAEGSFFRVIGVGLGGWRVQLGGSEVAKMAGYTNQSSVAGRVYSQYPNDVAEFFKVSSDTWVVNSYSVGVQ